MRFFVSSVISDARKPIFIASTIVLALGMDLTKKPVEDVPGFQG